MTHTPGTWRTRISHPRTVMAGGDRPGPGMGDDDGRSVPIGLVGVHSQVLGRMRAAIAKAEGR